MQQRYNSRRRHTCCKVGLTAPLNTNPGAGGKSQRKREQQDNRQGAPTGKHTKATQNNDHNPTRKQKKRTKENHGQAPPGTQNPTTPTPNRGKNQHRTEPKRTTGRSEPGRSEPNRNQTEPKRSGPPRDRTRPPLGPTRPSGISRLRSGASQHCLTAVHHYTAAMQSG